MNKMKQNFRPERGAVLCDAPVHALRIVMMIFINRYEHLLDLLHMLFSKHWL